MATIQSTLTFQDRMSAIVDKVTKSLENMTKNSNNAKHSIDNFQSAFNNASSGFSSMQASIVTLSSSFQLFNQVKGIFDSVNSKIKEFISYTEVEMRAQDQLSIITKQRMGLMDSEIRSLYDLASAQQKVGVVGDEVTVAGMAGIAAFVRQKSSIEALTPAMDNLAVKMYGYNATAESMDMISKSLGKAMLGDVGALSRMGIKIDDVTKKRLMHLKEEQRAIELAKLITNVTGDMNEEMAKTPFGQMTQANNRLSDSYEKLGAILLPLQVQMTNLWSNLVVNIIENLDKIVPITLAALGVIAAGFIALKAEAIGAALSTAAEWMVALWPLTLTIGIIGTVSAAFNAMGLSFQEQAENILISFNWIITGLKNIWIAIQNVWIFGENAVKNFADNSGIILANLFVWIAGKLQGIAKLIDMVFKTNLSDAINNFSNQMNKAQNVLSKRVQANSKDYKSFEANDIYTNQAKAQKFMSGFSGVRTGDLLGKAGVGAGLDGLTTNTSGGKALKTQNQGDIGIKEEDMELLHDLATRDFMLNYQQLTPQITIPGMVIHEEADVNQVIDRFASAVTELVDTNLSLNEGSLAA